MTSTTKNYIHNTGPVVVLAKGRYAGRSGRVIQTFGRQSVVLNNIGVVFRTSLTKQSQRELLAVEAGVTWEWLTTGEHNLSPAEADAWLGISW
jgi:hypothetical protein